MLRWSSPSSSGCWRRSTPAASTSGSAGPPAPIQSPPTPSGARPTRCRPTSSPSSWASRPRLSFVRRRTGRPARLVSPDEAAKYEYSGMEQELLRHWGRSSIAGGPETVRKQLEDLADKTRAEELMILTSVYDHADRV